MNDWTFVSHRALWEAPGLSFEAKGIWHILMSFRSHKTGKCRPSIFRLTKMTGHGRDRVRRYMKELEVFGALSRERVKGLKGQFNAWEYTVHTFADRLKLRRSDSPSVGNHGLNNKPVSDINPEEEQGSPTDELPTVEEIAEYALEHGTPLAEDRLEEAVAAFRKSLEADWAPGLEPSWQVRALGFIARWEPGKKDAAPKPAPKR